MNSLIYAKIRCVTLIFLLLVAISVVPVAATQNASTCSGKSLTTTVAEPITTRLSGPLADSLIIEAMQNKNLLDLQAQLEKKGFVKKEASVYSVKVSKPQNNDSYSTGLIAVPDNPLQKTTLEEYYVVGFHYISNEGQSEYLHYIVNTKTGEVFVVQGAFDCVTCLFELGAAGAACFAVCTTLGGFTGGVACGVCLGLAPVYVACPCWSCGCQLGQEFMCVAYDEKC